MHINWKFACLDLFAMILAKEYANPALFASSKFVVGSSRAKTTKINIKDKNIKTKHTSTEAFNTVETYFHNSNKMFLPMLT